MTATLEEAPSTSTQRSAGPLYDVLLAVMVAGFAALGMRPLSDPDVWWHLRTGRLVVTQGFTSTDPWSDFSSRSWELHEWGAEAVMYLAYLTGGYRGVIALHAVGMLVLALLIARAVRREASSWIAVAITGLALLGLFLGSAERPQLASWCLLAATLPAVHRAVLQRRPPWFLAPLTLVWANVHGLWVSVLFLYAALVAGLVLEVGVKNWRAYARFMAVGLASAAAACVNPAGPKLLLTPLVVREYAKFVTEWAPPSLLDRYYAPAYAMVAILMVCWARSKRHVPKPTLALVLAASYLGLSYNRTIPIAVICLAPLAAAALHELSQSVAMPHLAVRRFAVGGSLLFLILAVLWLPQVPGTLRGAPWDASRTLDDLPGRARVLNEYDYGGWLLWTARDTSPGIDGRTEIYSPEYVGEYTAAENLRGEWRRFLREQAFDAAWLRRTTPLVYGLRSLGWRTAYSNGYSLILVPPGSAP